MSHHGELKATPGLRREGGSARAQSPLGALLLGVPKTSVLPRAGRMEPKEGWQPPVTLLLPAPAPGSQHQLASPCLSSK